MRRTVGSYGIAVVGLISSIKDLSKIISRHLDMAMRLVALIVLKKTNQHLKLSKIMNPPGT